MQKNIQVTSDLALAKSTIAKLLKELTRFFLENEQLKFEVEMLKRQVERLS